MDTRQFEVFFCLFAYFLTPHWEQSPRETVSSYFTLIEEWTVFYLYACQDFDVSLPDSCPLFKASPEAPLMLLAWEIPPPHNARDGTGNFPRTSLLVKGLCLWWNIGYSTGSYLQYSQSVVSDNVNQCCTWWVFFSLVRNSKRLCYCQ